MEFVTYYDIGLNLFCKQFPDPGKMVAVGECGLDYVFHWIENAKKNTERIFLSKRYDLC